MIQWRRFVFYYICCLTVIQCHVDGCVETFPDLFNSITVCSNLTNQCTVSCVENHIYYDGNITKTYNCNDNNIWSPFVPKTGCLDQTRAIFWMRINVSYKTTKVAAYCLEAHEQALVDNEEILTQQVSFYCNSTLINVGRISINKTTSTTSSFKINTVFELEIGDSSTINVVKKACRLLLINNVKSDNFMVYGDRLECTTGTSSVTKQNATAESDVSRCPYSYLLVMDSDNGDYCVPNIPVVGVKSFLYSANISQDIVLHCDLLYGSSLSSVYWQHDGLNLTYSSKKYNGSTIDSPSLIIYNVTYDDDGEYTCNVGSGEGSSPVIILNILARVEDIPDVAIKKDEYIVIAGGIITLECTVTSFPEVDDVVWLRNTSGSTEQITADGIKFSGSNSTSPSLTISSADLADSGMYTCTATNVAGTGISIPAELYVSGVTEGNPTAGQSVDDTGILSCVQTFGYMLLFAAIGVVTLTFTTILLCICVPNDASSLVENIGQWKLSDKIAIIVIELYLSMITSCAVAGIYTIMECSEDITGATIWLTSVAIVPGVVLAACYLGICMYIQFKPYKKIAVLSDSKGMIPSTSPVPDDHCQIKSWRSYQHSELPVDKHEYDSSTEDKGTTMYANESDIYASTFRSEPLICKPSESTTPGRQALPPIDYKEHSEERMKRRRRRKKKRKKELFDAMNESNEEL